MQKPVNDNEILSNFTYLCDMYHDPSLSLYAREALMQTLTNRELGKIRRGDDLDLCVIAMKILRIRRRRNHGSNIPIPFEGGWKAVLDVVREYLRKEDTEIEYATIYSVPGVYGMLIYLGQEGKTEDILALDAFDRRYLHVPREEWAGTVIQATLDLPE